MVHYSYDKDPMEMVFYFDTLGNCYNIEYPTYFRGFGKIEADSIDDLYLTVSKEPSSITITRPTYKELLNMGYLYGEDDGYGAFFELAVANDAYTWEQCPDLDIKSSALYLVPNKGSNRGILKDSYLSKENGYFKSSYSNSTLTTGELHTTWTIEAVTINDTSTPRIEYFIATVVVASLTWRYFKVTCIQDGIEESDSYHYHIKRDIDEDSLDAYINPESSLQSLPVEYTCYMMADTSNASFSSIQLSKYINDDATDLTINVNSSLNGFLTWDFSTSDNIITLNFTYTSNSSTSKRRSTVIIKDTALNLELCQITFILAGSSDTQLPTEEDTSFYKDGIIVSCIDDNTGEPVDSTSLLYKGNSNNIYKTIDLKDNTLFLGNYTTKTQLNNIEYVINSFNINSKITKWEEYTVVTDDDGNPLEFNFSTDNIYSYVPNMKINSQKKRIFKNGETYLLGLVFLNNTGQRSSVYYIGLYSPSQDPYIDDNSYCKKPIYNVSITSELASKFVDNGIIGVIPVYALQLNHKIIALGFLNPALVSTKRKDTENIDAEYSWYLRFKLNKEGSEAYKVGFESSTSEATKQYNIVSSTSAKYSWYPLANNSGNAEILTIDGNDTITYSSDIYTINSPEIEVSEDLRDSDLSDCEAFVIKRLEIPKFINNINVLVNSKYVYSNLLPDWDKQYSFNKNSSDRSCAEPIWLGYHDTGYYPEKTELDTDKRKYTDFMSQVAKIENYSHFYVYPWLRDKIGAEGEDSKIETKKYFDTVYFTDSATITIEYLPDITDACIYRDFDTNSIIRVGNLIYLGNLDYILTSDNPYRIFTAESKDIQYYSGDAEDVLYGYLNFVTSFGNENTYAGYECHGFCFDPISIKYKSAPHIVLKLDSDYVEPSTFNQDRYYMKVVLLLHKNYSIDNTAKSREYLNWIKCGDLKRIVANTETIVKFEEGDYFFGRFDSLRTYPYTNMDPNSVTEIVSGMLCSRVNLDARTDRNRGVTSAMVTPTNFNLFNNVYDLANNYFTYSYISSSDSSLGRSFTNTFQWSLTKTYGSEIDDWCNIQDANCLDLDGDRGQLIAIRRNGNNLIAFLTLGISLILYNENTLVTTTAGVPIELANSGKVQGKRYLYTNIGCLNRLAICSTSLGLYFIDSINKTIYLLGIDNSLVDLCATYGMKSWGLRNLTADWRCYYDRYALEVLFEDEGHCLSYSDLLKLFQAFLSYEDIYHTVHLNDRLYLFNQDTESKSFTIWKKNASENMKFFDEYKQCKVNLIVNPYATLDKTFTNIYYRADCFTPNNGLDDSYDADNTFTLLRVWNEYLDTGIVDLLWNGKHLGLVDEAGESIKSKHFSSTLKKKFRTWRILIPRSLHGSLKYVDIEADGNVIPELITKTYEADIDYEDAVASRDRIRNPWCFTSLILNNPEVKKIKVHDIEFQYYI